MPETSEDAHTIDCSYTRLNKSSDERKCVCVLVVRLRGFEREREGGE